LPRPGELLQIVTEALDYVPELAVVFLEVLDEHLQLADGRGVDGQPVRPFGYVGLIDCRLGDAAQLMLDVLEQVVEERRGR